MNKGIVMEMNDSQIIVMTPKGQFAQIPLEQRKCQVGEEIIYSVPVFRKRRPWIAVSSSVAAAAVVLLILFNSFSGSGEPLNKQVVAYISIDINPSVEMGIDANNIVREIRGLNDDGIAFIKNVKIEGKDVDQATEVLMEQAESKYFSKGEGDIVISSTLDKDTTDAKVNDVTLSNKLKEDVIQHIKKSHPNEIAQFVVTAFAAPNEARAAAESNGLSTGKYAIYLSAKDNGQEATIDEFKKDSIHTIAKAKGGLDQLIKPESLTKEKIRALVSDEKDGSLDRKLAKQVLEQKKAEIKKNNSEDNNSDSKKSNTKASGKSTAKPTSKSTPKPSQRSVTSSASPTHSKTEHGKKQDDNGITTSKPVIKPKEAETKTSRDKNGEDMNKEKAIPTPTPIKKSSDSKNKGNDDKNSDHGDTQQKQRTGAD